MRFELGMELVLTSGQPLSTREFQFKSQAQMRFLSTSSTLVFATPISMPSTAIGHWPPSSHLSVVTKVPVSLLHVVNSSQILRLATMLV